METSGEKLRNDCFIIFQHKFKRNFIIQSDFD